jgi:hypothetical protein
MWTCIRANFTLFKCPSHIACIILDSNTLTSTVRAVVAKGNCCHTSLICQLYIGYCFDANYSNQFWARAGNNTTCPCLHIPCHLNQHHCHICQYTKKHIIFYCLTTQPFHKHHLRGISSLHIILQSQNLTSCLCNFLTQSKSSLFHPLLGPPSETPELRPKPWPDPPM